MKEYIVVRFGNDHTLVEVIRTTDLETAISEMKYDFQHILEYKYDDDHMDVFQQCAKNQHSNDGECEFFIDGESSEAVCCDADRSGTDYNWMIL